MEVHYCQYAQILPQKSFFFKYNVLKALTEGGLLKRKLQLMGSYKWMKLFPTEVEVRAWFSGAHQHAGQVSYIAGQVTPSSSSTTSKLSCCQHLNEDI